MRTGAWVDGEAEILAASRALNIVIRVWGRDEHHDRNIGDPSAATLVQLLHLNERHFQVVEPMPAAATATEPTDGFEVMPAAPPMPSSGGVNSLATAAVADPRKAAAAAAGERAKRSRPGSSGSSHGFDPKRFKPSDGPSWANASPAPESESEKTLQEYELVQVEAPALFRNGGTVPSVPLLAMLDSG